ncbi:hypothetical protein HMPREF2559_07875 [Corynebacterium sp. HMSC072G08]|uniref:helix-turn-helix domain-containing protein n=1 Tax=Corynebacterium TaxID=1716 RepID=UPI000839C448|nr:MULTISPECIES: helix-turn-helix domain-containing protein [Corynebacterium]OFN44851.1 hypothetical protein HMPREF2559_07875 [Corynebacterium sp. HMSC072G08]
MLTAETIGDIARERRREGGLTQRHVARRARVSERFVRDLETGKGTVQLDKALAVLAAIGLHVRVETAGALPFDAMA